jgi:poly(A) polymerase
VAPELDGRARRRTLHRLGAEVVRDLALLAWAGEVAITPHGPKGRNGAWIDLLGEADAWRPFMFPLKGRDALALGVPAGPRVGELLAEVEAWWEKDDFRAGREECLEKLKLLVGQAR